MPNTQFSMLRIINLTVSPLLNLIETTDSSLPKPEGVPTKDAFNEFSHLHAQWLGRSRARIGHRHLLGTSGPSKNLCEDTQDELMHISLFSSKTATCDLGTPGLLP